MCQMSDLLRRSWQFNPVSEVILRLGHLCMCTYLLLLFFFSPTEVRSSHVGKPGDVVPRAFTALSEDSIDAEIYKHTFCFMFHFIPTSMISFSITKLISVL